MVRFADSPAPLLPCSSTGNHDDPAGAENLSAIDMLAACNLVNYFGKHVSDGHGSNPPVFSR